MPEFPPPQEKRISKRKTRKLSKLFTAGDTTSTESLVSGLSSTRNEGSNIPRKSSPPQLPESLASISETYADTRPSSSASGHGHLTGGVFSTSSEAGSESAMSFEHFRRGKDIRSDRQLGENIPPSPAKRRRSLDLSSRGAIGTGSLKRSNSLWTQRRGSEEFHERYVQNFGDGTMSDQQRALNLRRARKMAQIFGEEVTLSYSAIPPLLRDRANSASSLTAEEDNPQTQPPFSTEQETPESSSSFQDRRRRAAKLSRFFGVGFQDISLPPEMQPPSPPEMQPPPLPEMPPPPPPEMSPPPQPDMREEVDVKVCGRRFWSFSSKNNDMGVAIQKLRVMKAG